MSNQYDDKKISLTECKKILNTNAVIYTDNEIIELRNWLYHMADIVFDKIERETISKS